MDFQRKLDNNSLLLIIVLHDMEEPLIIHIRFQARNSLLTALLRGRVYRLIAMPLYIQNVNDLQRDRQTDRQTDSQIDGGTAENIHYKYESVTVDGKLYGYL